MSISDDFAISHTENLVYMSPGTPSMDSTDLYIWLMLNGRKWSWNRDMDNWRLDYHVTRGGGWHILNLGPLTLYKTGKR